VALSYEKLFAPSGNTTKQKDSKRYRLSYEELFAPTEKPSVTYEELFAPPELETPQIEEKPVKKPFPGSGLVTEFARGLGSGIEEIPGQAIGSPMVAAGEFLKAKAGDTFKLGNIEIPIPKGITSTVGEKLQKQGEFLRDFYHRMATEGREAPDPEIMAAEPGQPNYGKKIAYMLGQALPLTATGMVVGGITKNPVAAASVFAPQAFGSFYEEARNNDVPIDKAIGLSLGNMAAQTGLEIIPFTGWLKRGGGITRRMLRGAIQEGLIENPSQQLVQNALEGIGWKGKEVNLLEGMTESILVGGLMGAGMGATPTSITAEDMKFLTKKRIRKRLLKQAGELGIHSSRLSPVLNIINTAIDESDPAKITNLLTQATAEMDSIIKGKNWIDSVQKTTPEGAIQEVKPADIVRTVPTPEEQAVTTTPEEQVAVQPIKEQVECQLPPLSKDQLSQDEVLKILNIDANGEPLEGGLIRVDSTDKKDGKPGLGKGSKQTWLHGLRKDTVDVLLSTARLFGNILTLNGGTEDGHSTTEEYPHHLGYKMDFSFKSNPGLKEFVEGWFKVEPRKRTFVNKKGEKVTVIEKGYAHPFIKEAVFYDEKTHWDVVVKPKSTTDPITVYHATIIPNVPLDLNDISIGLGLLVTPIIRVAKNLLSQNPR
jgi:hypothetical protein